MFRRLLSPSLPKRGPLKQRKQRFRQIKMFDANTRLDAAVAENDIQELRQFACNDLNGIADDCPEMFTIKPFKQFDPTKDMVPDDPFRHFVRGEFHRLFDTDVLCPGTRILLTAGQTVGDGYAF